MTNQMDLHWMGYDHGRYAYNKDGKWSTYRDFVSAHNLSNFYVAPNQRLANKNYKGSNGRLLAKHQLLYWE